MAAPIGDGSVEFVDRLKVRVDEGLVHERPQMLGGLQFRRVGWLVDEPDAVGNRQVRWRVPAGIVQLKNDDAVAARADLAGEGGEQLGEEGLVDTSGDKPDGLSACRPHEGGDVEPFVTMMPERERTFTDRCPDAPVNRLQADPVLVRRPDFDRLVRMFCGFLGRDRGELFLKAACSSGLADFGFLGRGDWIDQPIALSASQPRCGATRSNPNCSAIQSATLRLFHKPPSGGGCRSRCFNAASKSGLRTDGRVPLWRRRSPSAVSPIRL